MNRPELLGDCHDQCAHWSRNDSSNERANTNLPDCCAHLTAIFIIIPEGDSIIVNC